MSKPQGGSLAAYARHRGDCSQQNISKAVTSGRLRKSVEWINGTPRITDFTVADQEMLENTDRSKVRPRARAARKRASRMLQRHARRTDVPDARALPDFAGPEDVEQLPKHTISLVDIHKGRVAVVVDGPNVILAIGDPNDADQPVYPFSRHAAFLVGHHLMKQARRPLGDSDIEDAEAELQAEADAAKKDG